MSRILLVLNHHAAPSETFQRLLAVGLAEAGHEVVIHGLAGAPPSGPPLHPGVSYSRALPAVRRPGALVGDLARRRGAGAHLAVSRATQRFGRTTRAARAAALAGPILEQRPDAVHLGFSGIGLALEDALDLLDGIPLVVSCRGTEELVHCALDEARAERIGALLRRAARVHCVADAVADAVVAMGVERSSIRVIRPAVDVEAWAGGPRPAPHAPWRLATTTRLVTRKGAEDLLAAMAMLVEGGLDVQLTVMGDGPERDDLRLRALRLGLGDRVDWAGVVAPERIRSVLAATHLYVSASWSEGISNGVLEAMAGGVPVVSTEVGGMREVITPGEDGWLAPACRPDRLAEVIAGALSAPDRLASVAAAGRARVRTGFVREQHVAAWQALYGGLLGAGSPPDRADDPSRKDPTP